MRGAGAGRSVLLIAIGNPLRGDDGVAPFLLEELPACWPRLAVPQLTPELAAELVGVRRLLLLDAWWAPQLEARPQLLPVPQGLLPPTVEGSLSHRLEPLQLLALAACLYGARPQAAQLLLPAWCFPFTAPDTPAARRFSPALRRQLPQARALLRQWLQVRPRVGELLRRCTT